MIIDIHTHLFPGKLSERVAESMRHFYGHEMADDGSVEHLISGMKEAGISHSLIHSVAALPRHVDNVNLMISAAVKEHPDLFTGFAGVHPDYEDLDTLTEKVRAMGLKGYKLHPDMQQFALDAPNSMAMFDMMQETDMPVIIHTGDCRYEFSHPSQMAAVLRNFPRLTAICAHLGGFTEWEEGPKHLSKFENVYVDTSSSLFSLSNEDAVRLIRSYDPTRVLFGTDYPMWTPKAELDRFMALPLTDEEFENILYKNAERFLNTLK